MTTVAVLASATTAASIAAGFALLGAGLYEQIVVERPVRERAKAVIEAAGSRVQAAAKESETSDAGDLVEQAAVFDGLGQMLDGLAKFTEALKDLERSTRAYVIALAFFSIALASSALAVAG